MRSVLCPLLLCLTFALPSAAHAAEGKAPAGTLSLVKRGIASQNEFAPQTQKALSHTATGRKFLGKEPGRPAGKTPAEPSAPTKRQDGKSSKKAIYGTITVYK